MWPPICQGLGVYSSDPNMQIISFRGNGFLGRVWAQEPERGVNAKALCHVIFIFFEQNQTHVLVLPPASSISRDPGKGFSELQWSRL